MCQGNCVKCRALYFGPSAHTKEQSWLAEPRITETPRPSPGFQSRIREPVRIGWCSLPFTGESSNKAKGQPPQALTPR